MVLYLVASKKEFMLVRRRLESEMMPPLWTIDSRVTIKVTRRERGFKKSEI